MRYLSCLVLCAMLQGCTVATPTQTAEQAVKAYFDAWAQRDSITLATLIPSKDSALLVGRYHGLFSKNPLIKLREISQVEVLLDSVAFVDAVISVEGGPAFDTTKLTLIKLGGWKVLMDANPWKRLDRY